MGVLPFPIKNLKLKITDLKQTKILPKNRPKTDLAVKNKHTFVYRFQKYL